MRKSIAYLVLLLLPWVARAQALADWYYWFDTDNAPRQSGKMSGLNAHLQVDASQLEAGAHMLYIQVVDTAGVYSPPMGNLFIHVPDASKGSTLRYWFDGSTATYDQPYTQGQHLIDVGKLVPGFHFINYYVLDGHGIGTNVQSAGFYRTPMQSQQRLHYWFAGDSLATQVPDYQNGFTLDVTRLREGFNTIYFQVVENGPTDIESSHFIKIPQTECAGDMTVVCIIDGKVAAEQKLPNAGGVIKWNMDVSSMDVGLHKAIFQVITPSGAGSSIAETYFIRTLSDADIATMQCNYAIDGYRHYSQKGTCDNGTFHFDLPVNEVEDGLHRIDYMLVAENGATTTQGSDWFYKTPLGGNGIKQYDYWINDKSQDVHSETLAKSQDPFQLIKLLPLTQEPIRSSCFQFEVKDDKPMMYAKNDIHFRFHDKSGRWVDADRQYVDYSVSQEVKNIKTLKNEQTFARPDSNEVKWFKFEAAPGDTIGFKTTQATSIQVFAPSGAEIYTTSGDRSVVYGGAHTWEDGTYYVAIHDVTGSKPNITLDYMHLAKYDVVDQDVRVVGNGGCSTITFLGNGFKDLYAVDLKDSKGNVIQSIDVGHESDATTTVTFDFTDAELGKYNALFHFTEDDKTFSNCITVEEAKEIELATKVSFPSTFLRGTSVTYTVEITNNGNMTAYMVPLEIKLNVNNVKNIQNVKFDGHLKSLLMPDLSGLDEEDVADIMQIIDQSNDLSQFIIYHDSVLCKDYGLSQVIMTLPPNSSQTFIISIKSTENVHLEAWTTNDWFPLVFANRSIHRAKSMKLPSRESMCCMKDKFECGAEIVANIAGTFMPPGASCISSLTLTGLETAYDVWCSEGNSASERWNSYLKSEGNSLANRLIQSAVTCITGHYGARLKALRKDRVMASKLGSTSEVERINAEMAACRTAQSSAVKSIYDGITTMILGESCHKAFTETKPNCPPNPGGGGGPSSPVNSYDPNDIYGYIAPSGSMYVGEQVMNLPYRIEFENDTTFATSSAHTVVVKDTLDAKVFDFSSYQPTGIKIGDRDIQLKGDKEFVTTVDMRPEINAIAQVEGKFDDKKGIATWTFTSLDPMTMEPTDDIMQGFLPVNYDGSGIGEVAYNINRKFGLSDGTEISNKASIIFDSNDAIETPVWTNAIDAVPPVSHVSKVEVVNDTTMRIHFDGDDERSGVWKYALYVQYGEVSSWLQVAETDTTCFDLCYYEDIDYGFCVVATDAAGNIEKKIIRREYSFLNGEGEIIDGISSPKANQIATNKAYNLSGRLIQEEGYRGIIIKNKKKWLRR